MTGQRHIQIPFRSGVRLTGITQSIPNNVWTPIAFTHRYDDPLNLHNPAVDNTRITITMLEFEGTYNVVGNIFLAGDAQGTGERELAIFHNRGGVTTYIGYVRTHPNGTGDYIVVKTDKYLRAGDFVELHVRQTSGGALNLNHVAEYSPIFAAYRIW